MTRYFVSRQNYWGVDDPYVVEIAAGGSDYSGADMLVECFPELGEGQEFDDLREAVDAAIKIRDAWNKADPSTQARIEYGYTGGYTMPFEEYPTDEQAREWAEKRWAEMPQCDWCGERFAGQGYTFVGAFEDDVFCSNVCAEEAYADYYREIEDDEPMDEAGPFDPWGGW